MHGLFVAAGFCAHGIAGAGGVGRVIASGSSTASRASTPGRWTSAASARSTAAATYAVARVGRGVLDLLRHPLPERGAPRRAAAAPLARRTSGSPRSAASSARRAAGSGRTGSTPNAARGDAALRPRGWAGEHWSPAIGVEALACRDAVGAVRRDELLEARAPRARARRRSSSASAPTTWTARSASVIYTQLCNERGGIECDLTVTRLGGRPVPRRDRHRVRHPRPRLGPQAAGAAPRGRRRRTSHDVTVGVRVLRDLGPAGARAARAADRDRRSTTTRSRTSPRERISVGAVPAVALRVTYVGELGWELYCPTEYGAALWDTLWDAGAAHGMLAGGYRAIDALRVEKGYRVWSSDITPEDNPYEAGLGFAVKLDKATAVRRSGRAAADQGAGPGAAAALPRARRPARGARSVRSRCGSTARSSGGSRAAATASASAVARVRVPARGVRRARPGGRGRGVRRVDPGRRRARPGLRPGRRPDPGLSAMSPRGRVLAIDQGTSATKALVVGATATVLGAAEVPVHPRRARRRRRRAGSRGAVAVGRRRPGARRSRAPRARPSTRSASPTRARPCWRGTAPRAAARGRPSSGRTGASAVVCDATRGDGWATRLAALTGLAARPVLRGAEDRLAARARHARRRGHDDRHLAAAPPVRRLRRPTPRPRRARCCSISTPRRGPTRRAPRSASTRRRCRRSSAAPRRSARRPRSGPRSRCAGSRSTSRPRCSRSAASRRARPSARTAPARSCWRRSAHEPRRSANGLVGCVAWQPGDRWPGRGRRTTYCLDGQVYTAGAAVQWLARARPDRDAPPDLDALGGAVPDARRRRRSCPASPASARRSGGPTRAARSSGSSLATTRAAPRARRRRGHRGAGRVAGARRRRRPRRAAHAPARRRRAHALAPADADAGRPAAGAGRGLSVAARDGARRRRARAARHGRGAPPRCGASATWTPAAVYEPRIAADEAERWRAWRALARP